MTEFHPIPQFPKINYSRWERLYFCLFGRWPDGVVERRMRAHQEAERAWEKYYESWIKRMKEPVT